MDIHTRVLAGDCLHMLEEVPSGSVDLIVTSPPYADARKRTYGGIAPDEYVECSCRARWSSGACLPRLARSC